jgi:hypothetical protein
VEFLGFYLHAADRVVFLAAPKTRDELMSLATATAAEHLVRSTWKPRPDQSDWMGRMVAETRHNLKASNQELSQYPELVSEDFGDSGALTHFMESIGAAASGGIDLDRYLATGHCVTMAFKETRFLETAREVARKHS